MWLERLERLERLEMYLGGRVLFCGSVMMLIPQTVLSIEVKSSDTFLISYYSYVVRG